MLYNRSGLGINLQTGSFAAVTSSNSVTYPPSNLYVGKAGNVSVWGVAGVDGGTTLFESVPVGTFLPILITKIQTVSTAGSFVICQ